MEFIETLAALAAFSGWALPLTEAWIFRHRMRPLSSVPPSLPAGKPWPKLSAIVPACNEGHTIGPAMRSLLAVDYPSLEIIAIDDRSTDETGSVLDALAAADPRLRVILNTFLPAGWLGKSHALHIGAQSAAGEYILFTDADVIFAPDALRRAVRVMEIPGADHLTVPPEVIVDGWLERAQAAFFSFCFCSRFRPWRVGEPGGGFYVGVGAFNLVRAETYRAAGGHAAMPLDVLDDVKLGKLMIRAGGRPRCMPAAGLVRVRWLEGKLGMVRGVEKNGFSGFGYSVPLTLLGCGFMLLMTWFPWYAALWLDGAAFWLGVAGICAMLVASWMHTQPPAEGDQPPAKGLYGATEWLAFPKVSTLMAYAMLRSAFLCIKRSGIRWRGTFYDLASLRRGQL